MQEKITVTPDTRLSDVLTAYPWLPEALIARDPAFKKINSPLIRTLIKRSTVADAAKYTGHSAELLIDQLRQLVESREA